MTCAHCGNPLDGRRAGTRYCSAPCRARAAEDPLEVRLAMSGGCACEIPGGLGYINGGEPDWQNGAVAVDLYDDGDFYCSPMVYVPGRLLCREGRYEA